MAAARWEQEDNVIADGIQNEQQLLELDLDGSDDDSVSEADSEENDALLVEVQAEQMDYLEVGQEGEVKCCGLPFQESPRMGEHGQGQARALFDFKIGGRVRKFD